MSDLPSIVTPPEESAEAARNGSFSRSVSVVSTSSLSQWRAAHGVADKRASPNQSAHSTSIKTVGEERPNQCAPQVVITEATEREHASPRECSSHECVAEASSPNRSDSIAERSYRPISSENTRESFSESRLAANNEAAPAAAAMATAMPQRARHGDPHAVAGDESVRWSFLSAASPSFSQPEQQQQQRKQHSNSIGSPTAIAAAVPGIAQDRNSAAEEYAGRWTAEVRRSTAYEEDVIRAYRQLETELRESEKRMSAAETKRQREVSRLKAELQSEKEARQKAERDRDELLNQATMSLTSSPLGTVMGGSSGIATTGVGVGVLRVRTEVKDASRGGNGDTAEGNNGRENSNSSAAATSTTTYISEAFYEKMKEREDRARARVRKEFVRQAQESIYAEQKKTAEAEKAASLATRRLQQAEEDLSKAQDALQEANNVLEAKDVQLHERAIHVQELEAQLRLLQRQLESAKEAATQEAQLARRKLEEVQKLADLRQSELAAQRGFAQQLQERLGLTTRDLFDQESSREGVLQLVVDLQTRCKTLEEGVKTSVREATALLDQRRQQAELDAAALREQNEELKKRCAMAEGAVASMQGQRACDAEEMALLRERYEKDLSDQNVEVRSLQLQLERVLDAAKHASAESATAGEIERQQQAALLRQYAAEATAAREEVDRTRALSQRENEKHLRTILELSQQLTALKQANTRLEHKVNVHEHESADAMRLLSRARAELTQLREERRRLSVSLIDFREDSRLRSVLDSSDVLQRRVAELENVRRDLHTKLMEANETIEELQRCRRSGVEDSGLGGSSLEAPRRVSSVTPSVVVAEGPRRVSERPQHQQQCEKHVASKAKEPPQQPSRGSIASTTPSLGLPEMLDLMAEQLEPIIHPHTEPLHQEDTAQQVEASSVSSLPLTLRERRLQQSFSPEEREALDRVLVSCSAALRCNGESKHVVDSPSKSRLEEGAQEREDRGRKTADIDNEEVGPVEERRNNASWRSAKAAALTPSVGSSAAGLSPLPARSGALADKELQETHGTGVVKADLPSPQDLPARPRRSSRQSLSSVVTDDVSVRFRHNSEALQAPLLQRRAAAMQATKQSSDRDDKKRGGPPTQEKNEEAAQISTDASFFRNAEVTGRGLDNAGNDHDELESEPCWDSRESEPASASPSSLSKPFFSSEGFKPRSGMLEDPTAMSGEAVHAPPSKPRRSVGSAAASVSSAAASAVSSARASVAHSTRNGSLPTKYTPNTTATATATATAAAAVAAGDKTSPSTTFWRETNTEVAGDGILRYSRIPAEAVSPLPRETSPSDSIAERHAVADDAGPSLFSNVQYASTGDSVPRSSHRYHPLEQQLSRQQSQQYSTLSSPASSVSIYSQSRPRAAKMDGALVIDVHQNTPPPPPRRRAH